MIETPNNIIEKLTEVSKLPETIQKVVIKSFRSLFENPEFAAKVQEKINTIPEYVERMQLTGVLNRISGLQSDVEKVSQQTKNKLGNLWASIDPKITQPYNSNTTA